MPKRKSTFEMRRLNAPQVSHCLQSRRLAVGTKTGQLAMYELRASKVQMIAAHKGAVAAAAFAPDGKNLATYSHSDNRLCFWQTSTGMFGLGNAQGGNSIDIWDFGRFLGAFLGQFLSWQYGHYSSSYICPFQESFWGHFCAIFWVIFKVY